MSGEVPVSGDFVNNNIQPHPLVEHFSYWAMVRWSPLRPFPLMCLDTVNLSPDWCCCCRSSEIITWPDKFPTINIPLDEMKNVQRRNTRIICKFQFHYIGQCGPRSTLVSQVAIILHITRIPFAFNVHQKTNRHNSLVVAEPVSVVGTAFDLSCWCWSESSEGKWHSLRR